MVLIRKQFSNWVFGAFGTQIEETIGLNSVLMDGKHILMWETDMATERMFRAHLQEIQRLGHLPNIYIMRGNHEHSYHAYCLRRSEWREAIAAAISLPEIDMEWMKACMRREYFTLRIGFKHDKEPAPCAPLLSWHKETVKISELVNYDRYEIHAHGKL